MLEQDDMDVLDQMNKMKRKKSFKDIVNGKNVNKDELDSLMLND